MKWTTKKDLRGDLQRAEAEIDRLQKRWLEHMKAAKAEVSAEQVWSLAESYAYDRWPDQTVQDDPELITEVSIPRLTEWLRAAGIEVSE